ncbi:MAG TPA: KH domain-containing protein [Candidatus Saccharimonadales bacterium]|nr:KH domain-containing protein [Candidatus Saccharimonadales bacterium]
MEEQDKKFLEIIVKQIVGNPNDVVVDRTIDERGVLLTLKINPADMGYVIGRKGQTAQAIRTLLKIVGAKNNSRVNLKIYDPEGGNHRSNMSSETPVNREEVDTSAIDDLNI